jgi:pimeloyl-ACP methyl ester carboxylesterase
MEFKHKSETTFKIDSANIYYEEIGNPLKQPLIFLHGGFGNIEDFNGIIPLLEKEYLIIGMDSRGQGKSTLGDKSHIQYVLCKIKKSRKEMTAKW